MLNFNRKNSSLETNTSSPVPGRGEKRESSGRRYARNLTSKSSRIQGVISNISSECKCINHAIYLSDGPNSSLDKCVLSIKRNKKYRRDVVDQMRTDGLLKEKEDLLCRHCYAVNMRKFFSSDDTGCDAEIEESEEPVAQVDEEDKEKTIEHHLT